MLQQYAIPAPGCGAAPRVRWSSPAVAGRWRWRRGGVAASALGRAGVALAAWRKLWRRGRALGRPAAQRSGSRLESAERAGFGGRGVRCSRQAGRCCCCCRAAVPSGGLQAKRKRTSSTVSRASHCATTDGLHPTALSAIQFRKARRNSAIPRVPRSKFGSIQPPTPAQRPKRP